MPTLSQLRAKETAQPVFQSARVMDRRLTDALALRTIHGARLEKLRGYVRWHLRHANAAEMGKLLALYGPAFETTIGDAVKAARPVEVAIASESTIPPLGKAA